ncbi:uncharacterized protein LOC125257022 isoform X2 [Megalobrama amblycephala]|uniref:uncharacterized protein LOC125257022 isoform X2 n=1 Tax=Megalobrama amblycephala TaxID=75352 RepID=UPI00201426AA|nr:uncharacterized protein LOC125257022 isoform X2 [Megalobrama amblycephala]
MQMLASFRKKKKKTLSCDHYFHLMLSNRNSQSRRAAKMLYVLKYSFLLISICIRSMSWAATSVQVIKGPGHDIIIECSADKTPQDGVYMYKQGEASKQQEIFYFYKPKHLTYKTMNESKVSVIGELPNLTVTLLNVNAEDSGLYWCEFNLEEKTTLGMYTWLWIEKEKEKECPKECPNECSQEHLVSTPRMMIILCAVVAGFLWILGIIYMIRKGCSGKKKQKPSNVPSDSVYEEMKRSNLDARPNVRTFVNPDYQSSKQLR